MSAHLIAKQTPEDTPIEDRDTPVLSVVVPIYNEEESIPHLHERLTAALEALERPYEIIAIDDGSRDRSYQLLRDLAQHDPHLRVIRFRRNFGQTAAFAAGFDRAQGDLIVTIDADLQNDPADIKMLMEKAEEGYDVVSGWRFRRRDPFLSRRLPSQIANQMISWVTGVHLHDYGCSLKIYRADVVKNVNLYGELHRFIPAIASWQGVAVTEIPVNHAPRVYGKSKYGINRTIRVLLDLMTVRFLLSYGTRPMQVFGAIGLVSGFFGGLVLLYLGIERIILQHPIGDRPLVLLAILMVLIGVQFLAMGLLGELVIRVYYEGNQRPIYVVRDELNKD
jgi:glycosyltransferase involved in cell wall biosynthesis